MDCHDRAELTPLYLSGEIDEVRAAAFRTHLDSCCACAQEMEQHADNDARLREEIFREPVETDVLDAKIRSEIKHPAAVRWIAIAASFAAILFAAATIYRAHLQAELFSYAALDHHREVVDQEPRRWVSDQNAVQSLAERAGVGVGTLSALDARFQPAGYHFERGKLCKLGKSRFLHLVFSDGAREFSIFLGSRGATAAGKVVCADRGSDHVAAYGSARVEALIVTDESGDAALRFASSAANVL
jgi:hypothetical protein